MLAAHQTLAYDFGAKDYSEVARDFLATDPDDFCRIVGAGVISSSLKDTQNQAYLQVLAHVVRNEQEDTAVRTAAYGAMRSIVAFDPMEQVWIVSSSFNFPEDIDWPFVAAQQETADR